MNPNATIMNRERIKAQYRKMTGRKIFFILCSFALILLITGIAAKLGSYQTTFGKAYSSIFTGLLGRPAGTVEGVVIWSLRLPRIFLAIVGGIGFAFAGTMLQGILRNPIAAPFNLGIASFAGLGATIGIVLFEGLAGHRYAVMGNAFLFSLVPAFVILALTRFVRASPETIILSGIAMMYIAMAITAILMYFADADAAKTAYLWTVGDLSKANWHSVLAVSGVLLLFTPILLIKTWDVNAMNAGDEVAKNLGVNVERSRVGIMLICSVIVASIVCFTGTIGFVDLVAPHIARMVVGR